MIIYQMINNLNGKVYIGKTIKDLDKRIRGHEYSANEESKTYLHNAIRMYGLENFSFSPLAWCSGNEHLNFLEKFYIYFKNSKFPNGYNLTDGGDGGYSGIPISDKTRFKMSQVRKGKKHSDEAKKKMSASRKGIIFSEEHKKNISKSKLGVRWKKEIRQKMIESHKNISNETRIKLSESMKKIWTERRGSGFKKGLIPWNNKSESYGGAECQ